MGSQDLIDNGIEPNGSAARIAGWQSEAEQLVRKCFGRW